MGAIAVKFVPVEDNVWNRLWRLCLEDPERQEGDSKGHELSEKSQQDLHCLILEVILVAT